VHRFRWHDDLLDSGMSILLASLKMAAIAQLTILMLGAIGALSAHLGIFAAPIVKAMSKLLTRVLLPALALSFYRNYSSDLNLVRGSVVIFTLATVHIAVGLFIGSTAARLRGVQAPMSQVMVLTCALPHPALPVAMLPALLNNWQAARDDPTAQNVGLATIGIYLTVILLCFPTVVTWFMATMHSQNAQKRRATPWPRSARTLIAAVLRWIYNLDPTLPCCFGSLILGVFDSFKPVLLPGGALSWLSGAVAVTGSISPPMSIFIIGGLIWNTRKAALQLRLAQKAPAASNSVPALSPAPVPTHAPAPAPASEDAIAPAPPAVPIKQTEGAAAQAEHGATAGVRWVEQELSRSETLARLSREALAARAHAAAGQHPYTPLRSAETKSFPRRQRSRSHEAYDMLPHGLLSLGTSCTRHELSPPTSTVREVTCLVPPGSPSPRERRMSRERRVSRERRISREGGSPHLRNSLPSLSSGGPLQRITRDHRLSSEPHGEVQVTLHRAVSLKASDANGKSDPYVRLTIARTTKKSKTIMKTLDPVWEESFAWSGARAPRLAGREPSPSDCKCKLCHLAHLRLPVTPESCFANGASREPQVI
jgi:predicted permease